MKIIKEQYLVSSLLANGPRWANSSQPLWGSTEGGYYTCASSQYVNLNTSVKLDFSNIKVQAFKNGEYQFSGTLEECKQDFSQTDYIGMKVIIIFLFEILITYQITWAYSKC